MTNSTSNNKTYRPCNLKCEVYSRVVGYYRPQSNCNPGKKEEIRQRKIMDVEKAVQGEDPVQLVNESIFHIGVVCR